MGEDLAPGGIADKERRGTGDSAPPSSCRRFMSLPLAVLAGALKVSLVLAVAIIVLCIVYQVLMRYIVGQTPSWSEEVAILMFAWATLGGIALGIREGFHVRLTLLLDPMSDRSRLMADRAIDGVTAALGFYLVWSGWRFVDMTEGSVSAAIGYPTELLHGMAPVCGLLMGIFAVERMVYGAPAERDGGVSGSEA
ncbi:MAG: hypothetical protein DI537_06135 [Stutzerimonas stutzeri]|nr:MAG: hypothetical protein DI537_06135 [Stutzerimonas stutzeri]